MTHKHFITAVLLAAFSITGIQASGGFADHNLGDRSTIAQKDAVQGGTPAS